MARTQPRSQGLSSSLSLSLSLAPGGGKKREPGNEVGKNVTHDVITHAQYYKRKDEQKVKHFRIGAFP